MGFAMWRHPTQFAQFIVLIVFTPFGIAVTVLRFVATRRSGRRPGLEDWLAAVAALFFVLCNFGALMSITTLNGRPIAHLAYDSPPEYKYARKWSMVGLYMYFMQALTFKLSVLALYYRIFGVNRAYRIWIYVLAGGQGVLIFLCCVLQSQVCHPFERWFDRTVPGTCKSDGLLIVAAETPNSIIDFAMVVLAIMMVRSLHLSAVVKWRLGFLFGLGALVGIVGFIKVAITFSTADVYSLSMVSLLSCVQMFLSILCCCLPVFHSILPSATSWGRFSLKIVSYATLGKYSGRRSTIGSGERSARRSALDSANKQGYGWNHLEENHSARALAWPEASHECGVQSSHELSSFNHHRLHPLNSGIRVERRIEIEEERA